MTATSKYPRQRLKFAATINDEALTEDVDPDFEIQYIDIGNVDSSGTVHEIATYRFEAAPSRARRIVRDGDVIISTVRTYLQAIAPIASPPDNLIVSTGFAVIRPRVGALDAKFCRYVLREPTFLAEVEMRSTGISYPAINASEIGDIEIPYPPVTDQQIIADFIEAESNHIDALTAAKQRLLDLLAEKRRAIVAKAVMRGLNPATPLHPSGIDCLGDIPAHWEACHLKRVLARLDYGTSDATDVVGSIAILRMGDIRDGELDFSKLAYLAQVEDGLLLQEGDLVFNRTNSLDQIGKVALFRGNVDFPVSFASYLVRLRCEKTVLPEYLNWVLNSSYALAWARAEALPSIGQANLNPNRYGYLPIALPPLAEQQAITKHLAESVTRLDGIRAATEHSITLLKERRGALIAAAVTGQIDMPEAE